MTRITLSNYGQTPFQQLLGHNHKVADAWSNLGGTLESDELLAAHLKEQVRRTLSQSNGCEYCKAKGKPERGNFDEKTSIAVGFAEFFLAYPKGMVPNFAFEVLYESFYESEISELCAFISFTTAQQYFGALMNITAEATQ